MIDSSVFKQFDPGSTPLLDPRLNEIAKRARTYLKGRSHDEIMYAVMLANWILDGAPERDASGNPKENRIKLAPGSPASQLLSCIGKFDLSGIKDFANAEWSHIFSALALSLLAQANRGLVRNMSTPTHIGYEKSFSPQPIRSNFAVSNYSFLVESYHFAIDAMEAICVADTLWREKELNLQTESIAEQKACKKISLRMSDAAVKRHEPIENIKRRFIDYWQSTQPKSIRSAARKFWKEQMTPDEQSLFNNIEANAVRTLSHAISKRKKNAEVLGEQANNEHADKTNK